MWTVANYQDPPLSVRRLQNLTASQLLGVECCPDGLYAAWNSNEAMPARLSLCSRKVDKPHASTIKGTSWIALFPDFGKGRGIGWGMSLVSIVRHRRR